MKAILLATLGKDAELKDSSNGNGYNVCFSVCENTREKVNGEWIEISTWYSCLYHVRAESRIHEYLLKGVRVMILGDLSIDTFLSEKTGKVQVSRNIFVTDIQIASMPRREVVDPATGEVIKEDDGLPF